MPGTRISNVLEESRGTSRSMLVIVATMIIVALLLFFSGNLAGLAGGEIGTITFDTRLESTACPNFREEGCCREQDWEDLDKCSPENVWPDYENIDEETEEKLEEVNWIDRCCRPGFF